MLNTSVFFKAAEDVVVQVPVALNNGEIVASITQGPVTPVDSAALLATIVSGLNTPIQIKLVHGAPGVSYGFPLTITTNQRVFVLTVAVSVGESLFNPYHSSDPGSFHDLVDSLPAGNAALGTVAFQFPIELDPSGGFVTWELLDADGIVYSAGNAFEYRVQSTGLANTVIARSVVTVPSSTPATIDKPYSLRYKLTLDENLYFSYETLRVTGFSNLPLGSPDLLEVKGDTAVVSIVTDELYDSLTVSLEFDDSSLGVTTVDSATRVSSGYYYAASFDTSDLPVSIEPYIVMWKYGHSLQRATFRESSKLWVVNSSIMSAVEDVKAKVNKARQTLYGTADSSYDPATIMLWLRRARDAFNSSYGVFTSFTMTGAKGTIREYWLMYAELMALESQYLFESESAFNFSGANISLDVDRTGFIDSAISRIQSRLDNEFKPVKQNLIYKGATSGDGSVDPTRLQKGAIGAVGITLTPASPWGYFSSIKR